MRVAIVFFSGRKRDLLMALSKAVARGVERQGHQVDTFDGIKDSNIRLTTYQYVVVGAEPVGSFGGKVPEGLAPFLANSGAVSGKKCYAFVSNARFGAAKSLTLLMKTMEAEGMLIKTSDILRNATEAEEIGTRLHIQ
jgi:menaquinone-dependent protoporphyrinogen IX oxidase